MAKQRSLKHEYELYIEHEIEAFKDSVSRGALLAIGDEAVAALGAEPQTTLTEVVLWEEVDRIIAVRLKLPGYPAWRRRRLRRLAQMRRPEHWGFAPDGAFARALREATPGEHVLLAGTHEEATTLFTAAHGCSVTALTPEPEALERVFAAADEAGVGGQVRGCVCPLGGWAPDVPLRLVMCTADAFADIPAGERVGAVGDLRRATQTGGVHLLRGDVGARISWDEWRSWYAGWTVSAEDGRQAGPIYLARNDPARDVETAS